MLIPIHGYLIQLVTRIVTKPLLCRDGIKHAKIDNALKHKINIKHRNIRKWMVEFLSSSVVVIKFPELAQLTSQNLLVNFDFLRCCGPLSWRAILHMHSPHMERSMFGKINWVTYPVAMWPVKHGIIWVLVLASFYVYMLTF